MAPSKSPPCAIQFWPLCVSYQVAPSAPQVACPVPSFHARVIRCASTVAVPCGPHFSHSDARAETIGALGGMERRSKRTTVRCLAVAEVPV